MMKKIIKFFTLILTIFLLTACYPFSYLEFAEFVKNQGNGYEGTVKYYTYQDSFGMYEDHYAFYDQYHHECGLYSKGTIENLNYYTQLVFNDGNEAKSFVRFDLDMNNEKTYEYLGVLHHKDFNDKTIELEMAWEQVYNEGSTSLLREYKTFLLNSIARLVFSLEEIICPRINKTLKDFGFNI